MDEILLALESLPTPNALAGIFGFAAMAACLIAQVAIVIEDTRKAIAFEVERRRRGR